MSAAEGSRTRDPAARRQEILEATLEVIAEVGLARTSHRAIARRAGVPLGSTTYYFPTLDALTSQALELVADRMREEIAGWSEHLGDGTDLAADLAGVAHEYIADRPRALLEYELYLAAARTPELRSAAIAWVSGVRDLLTPMAGREAAVAIAALIDGFLLESLATGVPTDVDEIRNAISRITDC